MCLWEGIPGTEDWRQGQPIILCNENLEKRKTNWKTKKLGTRSHGKNCFRGL